nr:nicotinamide-nucleotide amidohydrolase family protein [Ornithinimicrobium cryptoxanthini]
MADRVVALLREAELTVATAESLTGGLVAAALTSVPGASAVVLGGVVSYALSVKEGLLGVPKELLEEQGAVAADSAAAMADGVRRATGAAVGVATTGVAGPEPSEGKPVGTVFVAVSVALPASGDAGTVASGGRESRERVRALNLRGSRDQIRTRTVENALELVLELVSGTDGVA